MNPIMKFSGTRMCARVRAAAGILSMLWIRLRWQPILIVYYKTDCEIRTNKVYCVNNP